MKNGAFELEVIAFDAATDRHLSSVVRLPQISGQ